MTGLRLGLACLALAFGVAGCATDRTYGGSAGIEIADLEELPAPRLENLYLIGPQEVLQIEVVGAARLSGNYLTDGDGQISFPLVGLLDLDGMAPSEAADLIANSLRGNYLRNPQVRVIPANIPPRTVSVGGQVKDPGEYPVAARQSLLRVGNQAGGRSESAQQDDVLIMRTVGGQRFIGAYNLRAIQRGNYEDPAVYPNDIVYVGDSPARRRLDTVLAFAPLLSTAVFLLDRIGQ